jgi:hypothetical protein
LEEAQKLYALRDKYARMVDGFQALCSATHQERNIMLSHFVSKMHKKSTNNTSNDKKAVDFVLDRTKRQYLNFLMRALKMYKQHHGLTHIYGKDWSWCNDLEYAQTFAALKTFRVTNKLAIFPEKTDHSATFMSDDQWNVLHEHTWQLCKDTSTGLQPDLNTKQLFFLPCLSAF